MIYLLLVFLLVIVIINYYIFERDFLCPSFVFSLSLCFGVFWACLFSKRWELGLHLNTFVVIGFGAFEFMIVSYFVHNNAIVKSMHKNIWLNKIKPINKTIMLDCFLLLLLSVTLFWTAKELTDWAQLPLSKVIEAGKKYDRLKFETIKSYSFPSFLSLLRLVSETSGYYYSFKFMNHLIYNKKINFIYLSIIVLTFFNSTITGARTGAFNILLGGIFYFFFFLQKKKKTNNILTMRMIFGIIALFILVLVSFPLLGKLLQRGVSNDYLYYLALYIGAEVKNLDIFLQKRWRTNKIWGSQTFVELVHSFGRRLGVANPYYTLDLPFQSVNGYGLGNVYTVFYPFIYDFGYIGWFVLTAVMAVLSQIIYDIAKYSSKNNLSTLFVLIYGTMFNTLLFVFFSNKYFETNFTVAYFKRVIIFMLLLIIDRYVLAKKHYELEEDFI